MNVKELNLGIKPFNFRAAPNLADRLNQLDQVGSESRIFAGGKDFVLNLKKKTALPKKES
jgi:CO/xanthine dehydrogenase FAD-binding subunit